MKKWALHARGREFGPQTFAAASPEALEQFLGCQGHIHAVALCSTFEQIAHRGLLHTTEQRVLADYMLFSRHRCLEEVLWTRVLELWTLDEPVPFASVLHGGSLGHGQRQDVVHVDGNWVSVRHTMVTNLLGQRVHLADVLQRPTSQFLFGFLKTQSFDKHGPQEDVLVCNCPWEYCDWFWSGSGLPWLQAMLPRNCESAHLC